MTNEIRRLILRPPVCRIESQTELRYSRVQAKPESIGPWYPQRHRKGNRGNPFVYDAFVKDLSGPCGRFAGRGGPRYLVLLSCSNNAPYGCRVASLLAADHLEHRKGENIFVCSASKLLSS